jgi:regulator of sigma E protease
MTLVQTLIAFLVALTILIFVHELGHFLVARWCGVKVLRFSIGFGKPLFTRRVGPDGTEWSVSAIPLGGYVKMLDEREATDAPIDPAELHRAFNRQSLGRRSLIVAAGPVANFLLAIALYWTINVIGVEEPIALLDQPASASAAARAGLMAGDRVLTVDGAEVRSWNELRLRLLDGVIERRPIRIDVRREGGTSTVSLDPSGLPEGEVEKDFLRVLGFDLAAGRVGIASLVPDGAAGRAGLKAGDEITGVDGREIRRSTDLIELIRKSPGVTLQFDIQRADTALRIPVVPDARPSDRPDEAGQTIGRIGAGLNNRVAMGLVRYGAVESLTRSARQTWDMSLFSLRMLGKMVVGQLSWRNLSGPVAIADFAGQSARIGWFAYVSFLALISISLGVLNLLPVPVLDGGHLVYYGLEALRGKPLSESFIQLTQKAGLAVIGALMVIALFNDITRLIGS